MSKETRNAGVNQRSLVRGTNPAEMSDVEKALRRPAVERVVLAGVRKRLMERRENDNPEIIAREVIRRLKQFEETWGPGE